MIAEELWGVFGARCVIVLCYLALSNYPRRHVTIKHCIIRTADSGPGITAREPESRIWSQLSRHLVPNIVKLRVYLGLEWHFNYDVGRPCRCLSRVVTDTWHLSGSDSDNAPAAASWVQQSCCMLFTKLWWGGKFIVDPNCKLLPINTITAVAVTKPRSSTARRVISSPQLESNPGCCCSPPQYIEFVILWTFHTAAQLQR